MSCTSAVMVVSCFASSWTQPLKRLPPQRNLAKRRIFFFIDLPAFAGRLVPEPFLLHRRSVRSYLLKILFCIRDFSLKLNSHPQNVVLQIRFYDIEISHKFDYLVTEASLNLRTISNCLLFESFTASTSSERYLANRSKRSFFWSSSTVVSIFKYSFAKLVA